MVVLVGTLVTVWYYALLSMSARCLCHPPQLVVFMAAAIFASCCFKTFTVKFEGWPMILLIGMGEMMAQTALRMLALLVADNNML